MTMRAACILIVFLTFGCTGDEDSKGSARPSAPSDPTSSTDSPSPDDESGIIRGHVVLYFGPRTFPVTSGTLHVVGPGVNRTHALGNDGSFELSVSVGVFDVYANVPQLDDGDRCLPDLSRKIPVLPGEVSVVRIVCYLK